MNKIALLTYSTKPRGGVAHTLSLAEGLQELGRDVHVYALATGKDFFRRVQVPYTLIPCPQTDYKSMDEKVRSYIDIYTRFLSEAADEYDLFHAQDCISANALFHLREKGLIEHYVRTVHHIDDFTSESLIECQLKSIAEPDYVVAVSKLWERELKEKYSIDSVVINNGVSMGNFAQTDAASKNEAKKSFNIEDSRVILSIGGIEPRKNTITILKAFWDAKSELEKVGEKLVWLIGGGETLFDYRDYREQFFSHVNELGLELGKDIFVLGSVPEEKMQSLYSSADVFVFPSIKEGWGLVVLEAMASGIPVIASNIEPMTEYLRDGENAVLISPMDSGSLALGMLSIIKNEKLRSKLIEKGVETAGIYSWESAARKHSIIYDRIVNDRQDSAGGEKSGGA